MDFQLSGLLIKAIGIFILLAIIGGFVFGIVFLIRLLLKIIKLKQPRIITYYVIMILCILIVAASWILNMGWYRVILTWLIIIKMMTECNLVTPHFLCGIMKCASAHLCAK